MSPKNKPIRYGDDHPQQETTQSYALPVSGRPIQMGVDAPMTGLSAYAKDRPTHYTPGTGILGGHTIYNTKVIAPATHTMS